MSGRGNVKLSEPLKWNYDKNPLEEVGVHVCRD